MKKLILSLLLLFSLSNARVITLNSCINKALSSHPDINRFALEVEQNSLGVDLEESSWRPQISISGEYDAQKTYTMPQNGHFETVDKASWSIGANLTQRVFDFHRSYHSIKLAKIHHEISKLSLEDLKSLMRYQVKVAYAQLLLQKEAIRARKLDLKAKKSLYKEAKALLKQGLKTKADKSRFYASYKEAQYALSIALANYKKAKATLEFYIGKTLPKGAKFEEWRLKRVKRESIKPKEILKRNLQLKIVKENKRASYETYKAKELERLGSVNLVVGANRFDALSNYDSTVVGIRYSAPIYSGGRFSIQNQQNRIAQLKRAYEADLKKREISKEVKFILADLKEIKSQIKAKEAQLKSAKEIKKLIEARYKQGLATYIEVLDAQSLLLDAKLGLISAYYMRFERIARLEYLNAK